MRIPGFTADAAIYQSSRSYLQKGSQVYSSGPFVGMASRNVYVVSLVEDPAIDLRCYGACTRDCAASGDFDACNALCISKCMM